MVRSPMGRDDALKEMSASTFVDAVFSRATAAHAESWSSSPLGRGWITGGSNSPEPGRSAAWVRTLSRLWRNLGMWMWGFSQAETLRGILDTLAWLGRIQALRESKPAHACARSRLGREGPFWAGKD